MTETTLEPPISNYAAQHTHRAWWRALIIAGILLLVIGLCNRAYEVRMNSRYQVIGKVDPATGYQIRYTVSYRRRKTVNSLQHGDNMLDSLQFFPARSQTPVQWINTNVLHIAARHKHEESIYGWNIVQYTFRGSLPNITRIDPAGYPELTGRSAGATRTTHEYRLISGCPATSLTLDLPKSGRQTEHVRVEGLLIHPKDASIVYIFYCTSNGDLKNEEALREMKAIRDSIHIVKARQ